MSNGRGWKIIEDQDGDWYVRKIKRKVRTIAGIVVLTFGECYFPDVKKHNLKLIKVAGYSEDDEGWWRKRAYNLEVSFTKMGKVKVS